MLKYFCTTDYKIIPEDVGIVYKNLGEIDTADKMKTKSIFSWNLFEGEKIFAGTYIVTHTFPITKEFFGDVIGVLCQQIVNFRKELENGQKTN